VRKLCTAIVTCCFVLVLGRAGGHGASARDPDGTSDLRVPSTATAAPVRRHEGGADARLGPIAVTAGLPALAAPACLAAPRLASWWSPSEATRILPARSRAPPA
jgi:hypothetical protein